MRIVRTLKDWQALRGQWRSSVGFVPTMGALHQGHASLLERSVAENRHTVLSIYVNPTQFNSADDFNHYPDMLEQDIALARSLGVDCILLPSYDELYADGYRYQVREQRRSSTLCGGHRPGHFDGVLTVVLKLLNLVRSDRAYFGEKDYQQYELVRDMASAFFLPTAIVACETVREADGLAMSSRNLRLLPEDRALAPRFPEALHEATSDAAVRRRLEALGFKVDYIETQGARRYGAATLGTGAHAVRLIDNVPLPERAPQPLELVEEPLAEAS